MAVKDVAEERVPLSWLQFIFILSSVISATFTVTSIYNNFELDRVELNKLRVDIEKGFENTNRRIDTKTDRNKKLIEENHSK